VTGLMGARAEALWRATVYGAVAQLHLLDNVRLARPLCAGDVKPRPAGHWGTVPGTVWMLVHLALAAASSDLARPVPLLGAGHAGVAQSSFAWATGELAVLRPQFTADETGLRELARSFPDLDGLGSEVHPLLPAGGYMGGCLGGTLAFATGMGLDLLRHVVVPVIGDGECETPTAAAAWLPAGSANIRANILPVVHINGFRMGSRSLLGGMTDTEIAGYFSGFGRRTVFWHIRDTDAGEHERFQSLLAEMLDETLRSERLVLALRCTKGWGGPAHLDGHRLIDTPRLHKTPLTTPATDPRQLRLLQEWLASYQPQTLFDDDGRLAAPLRRETDLKFAPPLPACPVRPVPGDPPRASPRSFPQAVVGVLRAHAAGGEFRLFSPDELESNRLGELTGEDWVNEVLAEEVLLGWLAGWTATGRRGLLVSYEAFAPLLMAGLVGLLKQRRLMTGVLPSLNLLLTSCGWHNNYTHGDPSLTTALAGVADASTRILTPADPARLAITLDEALRSAGRLNVITAGKHAQSTFPADTISEELSRGIAIWSDLSDQGEPDLTVLCSGDLAAEITCAAIMEIRLRLNCKIRVVNVNELTVLGDPALWPSGLAPDEWPHYLGSHAVVLIVTLGHPATVWGLLAGRLRRPVEVIGWREPSRPMRSAAMAAEAGFDLQGLLRAAARLLGDGAGHD
jgi:xylulose-5-phosphate/fructose-6-phosphate phosphoketolase